MELKRRYEELPSLLLLLPFLSYLPNQGVVHAANDNLQSSSRPLADLGTLQKLRRALFVASTRTITQKSRPGSPSKSTYEERSPASPNKSLTCLSPPSAPASLSLVATLVSLAATPSSWRFSFCSLSPSSPELDELWNSSFRVEQ